MHKFLHFWEYMTNKPISYEFDYKGDFESLDTIPILNAHVNFINALIEVKNKKYPEAKLNVKIQGFKHGSLEIHQILEILIPAGIFAFNNYEAIKDIVTIFTDVLKLKKAVGENKFEHKEVANNKVEIIVNGNNNVVIVEKDAITQYQNNPALSKYLSSAAKCLEELEEVDNFEFKSANRKLPSVKMDKEDIKQLKSSNPYLETESDEKIYKKTTLYVKQPDLLPKEGKMCNWKFIHKGREITANIVDEQFLSSLTSMKFGQGDRLIADLKVYLKFDVKLNTFIETNKYEVIAVIQTIPKDNGGQMSF